MVSPAYSRLGPRLFRVLIVFAGRLPAAVLYCHSDCHVVWYFFAIADRVSPCLTVYFSGSFFFAGGFLAGGFGGVVPGGLGSLPGSVVVGGGPGGVVIGADGVVGAP